MHTCTTCNSRSKISVKLPQFAPDRKLAFVESVCEELIKDRFGPWYVFEPVHAAAKRALVPAAAGGALGRAAADQDLYGDPSVSTSSFLTYLRGIESSKPPVTIVPGTDPARYARAAALGDLARLRLGSRSLFSTMFLTLAQPRGSPVLHHAF